MTRDDPAQAGTGSVALSKPLATAALILALVGVAGLLVDTWRTGQQDVTLVARGDFWAAQDAFGSAKEAKRAGILALDRGESIRFEPPETDQLRYEEVEVAYQRLRDGSLLDLEFRTVDGAGYVLRVAPATTFGVTLFWREADGALKRLAGEQTRDLVGEPFESLRVKLTIADERVRAWVNDQVAIEGHPIERPGGDFALVARGTGDLDVERFAVSGRDGANSFAHREDLSGLSPVGFPQRLGQRLPGVLLAILYLALLLRAFCSIPPSWSRWAVALALALAPASIALLLGAGLDAGPMILAALFAVGLVPGFIVLRRNRGDGADRGARGGGLRAAALIALGFGLAASQVREYRIRVEEPIVKAELAASESEPGPPYRSRERVELGPHNAITVDGRYRNVDVRTRLTLREDSIFQVRLRAPNPTWPEGICLLLSTHPEFQSGFDPETRDAFARISDVTAPIAADAPFELVVEAKGRRFSARIDGTEVGTAGAAIFPEGSVVLLTAHGHAVVDGVKIDATVEPPAPGFALAAPTLAALLCLLFGLVYAGAARWAVGIRLTQALEITALGLLPAAWFFSRLSPASSADITETWALVSAMLVLFLPTIVFAQRIKGLGFLLLAALVVGGGWLGLKASKPRVWPVDDESLSGLTITRWSGDRLSRDLLHLQHPLYRRWNLYLAQHELRGRRHDLAKPEGVTRIACVGSSSTLGRKVQRPYSMRIEERLRAAGHRVEVLNGGVSGSVSARLVPFLEQVLLEFDPDVVTLSLYYNDSFALTQSNDRDYVASVCEPGHTRSAIEDFKMNVRSTLGTQAFARLMDTDPALASEEEMFQGENAPPLLFGENLRTFAKLLTERGIRLIFIKEPVAGDVDRLWRKEFYAAMEQVAAEYDIPVVDPSPTLQERGGSALFMDKVHPFDEGHEAVTEALFPTVEKVLRSFD